MAYFQQYLFVLIVIAFLLRGLCFQAIAQNIAMVTVNHALTDSNLTYTKRQNALSQARLWAKKAGILGESIVDRIDMEQEELQLIRNYLSQSHEFAGFVPGRQLLFNPNFDNDIAGWIQYRSEWHSTNIQMPGYLNSIIVFNHSGPGHGSLSQIVPLATGTCYIFKVTGAAERHDEILTFWLYWERIENGTRQGRNLISGDGNQSWQQLMGVFCLPTGEKSIEEVVVAPVNVYGDVIVYLENARLYELQLVQPDDTGN